jgi:hypothetical protein
MPSEAALDQVKKSEHAVISITIFVVDDKLEERQSWAW